MISMNKILSIIIPTYNMEDYLNNCLDSLLIEENRDLLEIIVVNDGSKDNSLTIACDYEKRFPNLFRVINKKNGNYGSCINRGLKEAIGKYVKILDADDSFDTENFNEFVKYLMAIDADLVLSDYVVVNEERKVVDTPKYGFPVAVNMKFDDVSKTDSFKLMQMHAVTYRLKNLIEISYKQTEGISYTDQQWIFIPMITVKSVFHWDKPIYKYLVGRSGQTMDPSVLKRCSSHLKQCVFDMIECYNRYRKLMSVSHIEYFQARLITIIKGIYIDTFRRYNLDEKKMLIEFDEELKSRSLEIYNRIAFPIKRGPFSFSYISFWRKYKGLSGLLIKLIVFKL